MVTKNAVFMRSVAFRKRLNVITQWEEQILVISEEPEEGFLLLEEIYQQKDEPIEPSYYKETALYLLSGGTTGVPKVIPKSHAGYICNTGP